MQDLNEDEIQKQINELKKDIPDYKPISAQGRLEICGTCPSNTDIGQGVRVCTDCGCLLAIKVRFPFTSCPLGKW